MAVADGSPTAVDAPLVAGAPDTETAELVAPMAPSSGAAVPAAEAGTDDLLAGMDVRAPEPAPPAAGDEAVADDLLNGLSLKASAVPEPVDAAEAPLDLLDGLEVKASHDPEIATGTSVFGFISDDGAASDPAGATSAFDFLSAGPSAS